MAFSKDYLIYPLPFRVVPSVVGNAPLAGRDANIIRMPVLSNTAIGSFQANYHGVFYFPIYISPSFSMVLPLDYSECGPLWRLATSLSLRSRIHLCYDKLNQRLCDRKFDSGTTMAFDRNGC